MRSVNALRLVLSVLIHDNTICMHALEVKFLRSTATILLDCIAKQSIMCLVARAGGGGNGSWRPASVARSVPAATSVAVCDLDFAQIAGTLCVFTLSPSR